MFKKFRFVLMTSMIFSCLLLSPASQAQEAYLGDIKWVGFNFAPRGWASCDGQLLPINQNQALFSLLGNTYGGDGRTTFALPDMRSRSPLHVGTGPGLNNYNQGQMGGVETVTLSAAQMPSHTHTAMGSSASGTLNSPANNVLGGIRRGYDSSANAAMDVTAIASAGGSQSHENRSPYLAVQCIIALQGIFPSRN